MIYLNIARILEGEKKKKKDKPKMVMGSCKVVN